MTDPATVPRAIAAASILVGSVVALTLLWLIYVREPEAHTEALLWLPGFNAACNASAAVCLAAGFRAVRRRRLRLHAGLMVSALSFSALFLAGYVTHHALHGDTPFGGVGAVRTVYLAILASHIGLSFVALPLILATFSLALTRRFDAHRRIARLTLPVWLYVSITGVLVYAMLRACGV